MGAQATMLPESFHECQRPQDDVGREKYCEPAVQVPSEWGKGDRKGRRLGHLYSACGLDLRGEVRAQG